VHVWVDRIASLLCGDGNAPGKKDMRGHICRWREHRESSLQHMYKKL
jgi:hypothetical protein